MDNVDPDFVNLLDTQADQGHRIRNPVSVHHRNPVSVHHSCPKR